MTRDVICDEAELAITANQIMDYAYFLDGCISTYIKILRRLQEEGIQDDLVCAKLSELAAEVGPVREALSESGEEVSQYIRQYLNEVAAADSFRFMSDLQGTVLAVLSKLL